MMVIAIGSVVLVLALVGLILLGVRRAVRAPGAPRGFTWKLGLGMGSWLALTGIVAASGFFSDFSGRPPRLMFGVGGAFVLFTIVSRSAAASRVIAGMPLTWPIALQSMRIVVELGLWGLYDQGRLPKHLTFEGRNFDVVVGLTAPVIAVALARRWIGTRVVVAWNILSICVLANIVVMAVTSIPGPLHLSWPGPANTIVAEFPYIWLPTFLVPIALFGHIVSLRQLLGVNTAHHDEEPLGRRRSRASRSSHEGQFSER